MMDDSRPVGVMLCNLGGPESLEEVAGFLRRLLSDSQVVSIPWPFRSWLARSIARRRAPVVAQHYRSIGGRSPIGDQSRAQAEAIGSRLGKGFVVRYAFRHSSPSIRQVTGELALAGVLRLVALSAFPQWSCTTTGSAMRELSSATAPHGIQLCEAPSYPKSQGFIQALAELTQPFLEEPAHLIISAHGLPERVVKKGDPYVSEVHQTAEALVAQLPASTSHSLAFQSRVGPVAWTRPYLNDEIRRLGREGVQKIVVVPVSFVCENLETLYELDVQMAGLAEQCGIQSYRRVPTPGCHAAFIDEMARLVHRTVQEAGWETPP